MMYFTSATYCCVWTDMSEGLRATVVLNTRPSEEREAQIAEAIVEQYAQSDISEFAWEISETLPDGIPVDMADQLSAHKRDAGEDSVYMVVWMQ